MSISKLLKVNDFVHYFPSFIVVFIISFSMSGFGFRRDKVFKFFGREFVFLQF